jgi:hypothetical protein
MTIDDDIIAPFIVGITTIVFTAGQMFLMPISSAEQIMDENQALFAEVSAANREIDTLTKQLKKYEVTEDYLQRLGASEKQAKSVIKASEAYDLSPKH